MGFRYGGRTGRPKMRTPLVLALCALLAGCAAVPKVNDSPPPQSSTTIVGARGPLTAQQSRALLDRIAPEPGDAGILKRHLAIEEAVAETPLVAGNATRFLIDGPQTFAATFDAIRGARTSINLEYYILEDIASGDEHLGDLLIARKQQGVAVNILYDSFGSSATPPAFFQRLKDAGINVVEFNPLIPSASISAITARYWWWMAAARSSAASISAPPIRVRRAPAACRASRRSIGATPIFRSTVRRRRSYRPCSWSTGRSRKARRWSTTFIFPPSRPKAARWSGSSAARPTSRRPVSMSPCC